MNFEIYLVGGIDFLAPVFRGLVILLGGNPIESFVKLNVLLGALFAVWISIFGRDKLFFAKHFIIAVIFVNLFFSPVANVILVDTKYQKTEVIQNFPFGPAFIISLVSNTSDFISQAIDNVFHNGTTVVWNGAYGSYVADLDYRENGFSGVFFKMDKLLSSNFKNSPQYSELFEMTWAYMEQCFIPDLLSKKVNNPSVYRQILKDPDLISSGNLRVQGFLIEWEGNVYTCNDFYDNVLYPKITQFKNAISNNPEIAGWNFYDTLNVSGIVQTLTLANYDFATAVSQAALINALRYVISSKNVDTYNVLAAYTATKTAEKQKLNFLAMGKYASEMLPKLRNFLIAIAVFFSFMLVPLIMIPLLGGMSPGMPILGFARYIIWTFLWDPMLALLDAGMKIYAIQKATSWLTQNQASGISILTYSQLSDDMSWYPAIAGYIGAVMVPSLSWMFVRGFEATMGAIAYMFSSASATVSAETQNIARNIERERFARMVGFKNAGELEYLGSMYNAMYEGAYVKSRYDYETEYGTEQTMQKLTTTQSVELQKKIGGAIGTQEFANKYFKGNVEEAQKYVVGESLTKQYGQLKAFEMVRRALGFDKIISTWSYELTNEVAKMEQREELAKLLGYIKENSTPQENILGVYNSSINRFRSESITVIGEENREKIARIFEAQGKTDIAQRIREGEFDGARLRFSYTKDGESFDVGNLTLEGGTRAIKENIVANRNIYEDIDSKRVVDEDIKKDVFLRERRNEWISANKVIHENVNKFTDTIELDLGQLLTQPSEVVTKKITSSLWNSLVSYGAIDEKGRIISEERLNEALYGYKQAMFKQLKKDVEAFVDVERSEQTQKSMKTNLGVNAEKGILSTVMNLIKSKQKPVEILKKLGFTETQAKALLKGDYSVLTSVSDQTLKNFISYYLDSSLEAFIGQIKGSAQDGILTKEEVMQAAKVLDSSVRGLVEENRDFSPYGATEVISKHVKAMNDEVYYTAGLFAMSFSPEGLKGLIEGGKYLWRKLKGKDSGIEIPDEIKAEIREVGEEIMEKTKELLGRKQAAKYADDFFKSLHIVMNDYKIDDPKEALGFAKHEFTRILAGKGVDIDKAEKIFEEIKDAFIKVSDEASKKGLFSRIVGGVSKIFGSATGVIGEMLLSPEISYSPELPQRPEDAGLDIKNGHFVIKNPELFKFYAPALGLTEKDYNLETGWISKEGQERIINYFTRYVPR